ncbi:glycoside hydrolase domain-containing protein [Cellulomonas phragmiteti]|uniref:Peptidoglycan binding-like domain-containing protein n=1 Tax=Cellulomonas phragmiteti TaxID=478780 RepID=A0ABQ4DNJ4_9CELL|nr:glycoside hydrolase domain-containing protein [Cellulomonas phragmiteti]GIG40919.1 hypothetical protein Cph01nite_26810 [Cellulomonas phragmiteti]
MFDHWVHRTQVWLNGTYGAVAGFVRVTEDGETGWRTIWALRRALQHELGLTALSDAFGPATTAAYVAQVGELGPTARGNLVRILQGGLWCSGYPGGYAADGVWDDTLTASVGRLATDMGLGLRSTVDVTMMKGVLSMDAYVLVPRGRATVRAAQQALNRAYVGRRDYALVPCDGVYSRDVQRGLVLGIQYELGMADGVANGNVGPGTQSGLETSGTVRLGDVDRTRRFVQLFQSALVFNGHDVAVDGSFGGGTRDAVVAFQEFACLPVTGVGDYPTWASLLVSTGDPRRQGTAADTSVPLLGQRAATLRDLGYETVGRYLTGKDKHLRAGEIEAIHAAGLGLVPIYQEWNNAPEHFTRAKGRAQGVAAVRRARQLGIVPGAVIYFPVDFDATDGDVAALVLPFFEGVRDGVGAARPGEYRVGVYGPRHVCSRVTAAGLGELPFVAGLSRGWSGNLGYPLPQGWAYDQIQTRWTPGLDTFAYDNNIQSPRAEPVGPSGVRAVPTRSVSGTTLFSRLHLQLTALHHWAEECLAVTRVNDVAPAAGAADLVLHHLQRPARWDPPWPGHAPLVEWSLTGDAQAATSAARAAFEERAAEVGGVDPGLAPEDDDVDVARWAAVCRAALAHPDDAPVEVCRAGDLGGWALDLALLWEQYARARATDPGLRVAPWFRAGIGGEDGGFSRAAYVADLDGYVAASMVLRDGVPLDQAMSRILLETSRRATWPRDEFAARRFEGRRDAVEAAVAHLFTSSVFFGTTFAQEAGSDPLRLPGQPYDHPDAPGPDELAEELPALARTFADVLLGQG